VYKKGGDSMIFSVNKEILSKELSKLQGVSEKRHTMIILANVLITAEKNRVSMLATNMEVGVSTSLDAEVGQTGKITVSTKNFYDIVKELPNGTIEVSVNDSTLKIKAGKVEFKIPTLPAVDFPKIVLPSKKPEISTTGTKLKKMLDMVVPCTSTDETKYHLNGIFIDNGKESGTMRMVSTDGHRLALIEDNMFDLNKLGASKGVILPKKGIFELRKLIETSEDVSMSLENGYFYFNVGNTMMFIKELELEYPDYYRVVPKNNVKKIKVKRSDFLSALKRVSLVTTIKSKTVSMLLNSAAMELSSRSPDYGEAKEELEVDYPDGTTMDVRFNSKYLIDIISAMDDEIIKMELGDALSPVLVKPDKEDKNYLYVVMPMRL
jgi:DNA polymerase III subunit beta